MQELRALALKELETQLSKDNIVAEVFTKFTSQCVSPSSSTRRKLVDLAARQARRRERAGSARTEGALGRAEGLCRNVGHAEEGRPLQHGACDRYHGGPLVGLRSARRAQDWRLS